LCKGEAGRGCLGGGWGPRGKGRGGAKRGLACVVEGGRWKELHGQGGKRNLLSPGMLSGGKNRQLAQQFEKYVSIVYCQNALTLQHS
jgi:hypothetical protein